MPLEQELLMDNLGWLRKIATRAAKTFKVMPETIGLRENRRLGNTPIQRAMLDEYSLYRASKPRCIMICVHEDIRLYARDEGDRCPICQETFLTGPEPEKPAGTRCMHIFGEKCLLKWIRSGPQTCPMCRADLREAEIINTYQDLAVEIQLLMEEITDHLDGERLDSVGPLSCMPPLEDWESVGFRFEEHDKPLFRGEASAAYLLGFFREAPFASRRHATCDMKLLMVQHMFTQQVEIAKRRLGPYLQELGLETLWDHRAFWLEDLNCSPLSLIVEDFLMQLVEAEEHSQSLLAVES